MMKQNRFKILKCAALCLLLFISSGVLTLCVTPDNVKAASPKISFSFSYSGDTSDFPFADWSEADFYNGRFVTFYLPISELAQFSGHNYYSTSMVYEFTSHTSNLDNYPGFNIDNRGFIILMVVFNEGENGYFSFDFSCSFSLQLPYYPVFFDLNLGTLIESYPQYNSYQLGSDITEYAPLVEREGYIFLGWDGDLTYLRGPTTFIAIWKSLSEEPTDPGEEPSEGQGYTVMFDDPYIISGNVSQRVSPGFFTVPPVAEREGYTFVGWSVNGELVDLTVYPVTSSIVFTAVWQEIDDAQAGFSDIFFWNWDKNTPAWATTVGWLINGIVVFCLLLLIFKRR